MKMIAACDANWGIGKDNRLLVSIPADMKFFREMTMGRTVVMGRKTLESFPGGKPLKGRKNIVLTSSEGRKAEGLWTVHSVEALLKLLREDPAFAGEEVYCIGGGSVYRLLLPYCDTAYITRIDHVYEADTFFPDLQSDPGWRLAEESEEQIYVDLTYHFQTYRRV